MILGHSQLSSTKIFILCTEAAASGPRSSHHKNQASVGIALHKTSCHTSSAFRRKSTGGSTHSQHTLLIRPHANITHRADQAKMASAITMSGLRLGASRASGQAM